MSALTVNPPAPVPPPAPTNAPPRPATAGDSPAATMDVQDVERLLRAVDETTRQLQSTHVTLHNEVGRLQGELAEANAQLRRSRALAALGEMAAGIAHEIRNPLGAIRLNAQMLAEDLVDRPAQAQLCDRIGSAVVSLDAIVRDVLAFARDMRVRSVPTMADDIVARAVADAEELLATVDVRVEADGAEAGGFEIEADPCLLTQAIGNLLRNAVEAMNESGTADRRLAIRTSRVSVRTPDGHRDERIGVTVEDSGPGIPDEVVERMFNPFFTTRATGTGLGLAIVHRIVDAHRGEVSVGTSGLGGACVEVRLPLSVSDVHERTCAPDLRPPQPRPVHVSNDSSTPDFQPVSEQHP